MKRRKEKKKRLCLSWKLTNTKTNWRVLRSRTRNKKHASMNCTKRLPSKWENLWSNQRERPQSWLSNFIASSSSTIRRNKQRKIFKVSWESWRKPQHKTSKSCKMTSRVKCKSSNPSRTRQRVRSWNKWKTSKIKITSFKPTTLRCRPWKSDTNARPMNCMKN